MSPRLFNIYMDVAMKELEAGMGKISVKFLEKGREWRLPEFLIAGGKLEEDLKLMGWEA